MSTHSTLAERAQGQPGLLIHAAGPLDQDALNGILRSAANARASARKQPSK